MLLQTTDDYFEFSTRHYNNKLTKLRTVELKEILSQIGGSEHGLKPDLVDRILDSYKEETKIGMHTIAKLIDKSYQNMIAARLRGEELPEEYNVEPIPEKNRCVCRNPRKTEGMIRCEGLNCGVWQHKTCVVNNPEEKKLPRSFYCEMCRLSRADPFCLTVPKTLLSAVKLPGAIQKDHVLCRSFFVTGEDKDSLTRKEYEVQAWCMLLNDDVPFRFHWPKSVELKVNGAVVKKAGMTSLGANSRDDGVNISGLAQLGINVFQMTYRDSRMFCFGIRFVERRTIRQVMDLIPGESEGEKLDDAVARVRRCINGGGGDDVEAVSDCVPVNLRCPLSGSRIKVAGRFKPCVHMGCFDLEVFLEMAMRSKKWQCPVCLKNYCLDDVIIDPYFNRVAARLSNLGLDVNEVEVKPDGSWRTKSSDNNGGLSLWYALDGSNIALDLNNKQEEDPQTISMIGVEFGDAEVINLSDSEEDETNGVARPCNLGASLKRAREALADCPFSVQAKRRRQDRLLNECVDQACDIIAESKMKIETTDCPKKLVELLEYLAGTRDLLANVNMMMETTNCSNSLPTEKLFVKPSPSVLPIRPTNASNYIDLESD